MNVFKKISVSILGVFALGMGFKSENWEKFLIEAGGPVKVTLRPLAAKDVDAFLTWGGDPAVTQSLFWDHYTDRDAAEEFLRDVAEKHPWFMAIEADGVPVGAITLDQGKGRALHRAELGYVVAKSQWGKGIATEAVRQALQRGFSDLSIERIEAFVDPRNSGSVRVLEKAGLIREGILKSYVLHRGEIRDRYIYAKTK